MEIQKMGHEKWVQAYSGMKTTLFSQAHFIQTLAHTYDKHIQWYVAIDKDSILFSIPILHKKRNASLVTHFFYQAIVLHQDFQEIKLISAWTALIDELKADFDTIEFKFSPEVIDIRSFIWAGFEHNTRYTSVLDLNNFPNYSENVNRSLKKALKFNLTVITTEYDESIITSQVRDMKRYGLGEKHAKRFQTWFKALSESKHTQVFQLKDSLGDIIGSSLFLYDDKQAYLIGTMGGKEESGGQAYLYDQAFRHFKELGINRVDLLGANIPSVALYKSKLGGEVEPYFMVTYHKHKFIANLSRKGKHIAKGMLKSLRIINK